MHGAYLLIYVGPFLGENALKRLGVQAKCIGKAGGALKKL